jgi:hypothetical protein
MPYAHSLNAQDSRFHEGHSPAVPNTHAYHYARIWMPDKWLTLLGIAGADRLTLTIAAHWIE